MLYGIPTAKGTDNGARFTYRKFGFRWLCKFARPEMYFSFLVSRFFSTHFFVAAAANVTVTLSSTTTSAANKWNLIVCRSPFEPNISVAFFRTFRHANLVCVYCLVCMYLVNWWRTQTGALVVVTIWAAIFFYSFLLLFFYSIFCIHTFTKFCRPFVHFHYRFYFSWSVRRCWKMSSAWWRMLNFKFLIG